MLFKRKNKQHNSNIISIQLPNISKEQLIFNQYLLKKVFTWQNKQLHISKADTIQKAEHYIGLHTEQGIFYIHNGISWLQKLTSIYIEHEDEDTKNWLLDRALEKLPADAFPLDITNLTFHHYINVNKYNALYLNGLSSKIIFASIESWINFFNQHKFIHKNTFDINHIEIHKNILLGKQKLKYTDYKKLVCGNIILINEHNFTLDGVTYINIGSFSMQAAYHDNKLIFQAWNNNMNDKPHTENENEDEEEWNQEESFLDEYNEFQHNEQQLNQDIEDEENNEEEYEEQEPHPETSDEQDNTQNIIEDETHPFANVPINLSFSLGTLRMPIAGIMQLQEGSVIELNKSTPAQVNIYANGKLIGTGDVIEIDGKLGVQINKLDNN